MTALQQGLLSGTAFGVAAVLGMTPMAVRKKFESVPTALSAAFTNRFGIGLVIPLLNTSQTGWIVGAAFGLLLSLPPAIITKAWAPILILGAVGGALIGGITRGW
jgi:hypothetical protein